MGDYTESEWRLFWKEISQFWQISLPSCLAICDAICLIVGTRLPMGRNSSWRQGTNPPAWIYQWSVLYKILDWFPNEFAKLKRARVALFPNCHSSKIFKLVHDGFEFKVFQQWFSRLAKVKQANKKRKYFFSFCWVHFTFIGEHCLSCQAFSTKIK